MSDPLSNHNSHKTLPQRSIVGLIPAAGKAERLSPLPLSKELLPIGFQQFHNTSGPRPKPVCLYLLEKMRLAGAMTAFIVLREGKWDIPGYLGDGKIVDMCLAYLMMDLPYGVPFTIDQAYPFVKDSTVLFGFPDILFQPENAFDSLLKKQAEANADIVLGLFKANTPGTMDMVGLNEKGKVCEIQIKPQKTKHVYTWITAVWTSSFTLFLHQYISDYKENNSENMHHQELFLSDVINAAIERDMRVDQVVFENGNCLDIGIPENLVSASADRSYFNK